MIIKLLTGSAPVQDQTEDKLKSLTVRENVPIKQTMEDYDKQAKQKEEESKQRRQQLLVIGQQVYCSLYGGKYGTIYEIVGQQSPHTCDSMGGGVMVMGGSANFKIVWDTFYTTSIPESLLRTSCQWDVLDEPLKTQTKIDELLTAAEERKAEEERGAEELTALRDKQRAELPDIFPYLIQAKDNEKLSGQALAAKNLRIELKREFPGHKFSVRSESFAGGCAVRVGWLDGPTTDEVKNFSDKYQYGSFNGMEDIYEYNEDRTFPDVFGSTKYMTESRTITKETKLKIAIDLGCKGDELNQDEHGNFNDISGDMSQEIYRESRKRSYYIKPAKAEKVEQTKAPTTTAQDEPTSNPSTAPDKEPPTIGDYKGNATICLPMGNSNGRGFCFGLKKAQAILDYMEEIKSFIDDNE